MDGKTTLSRSLHVHNKRFKHSPALAFVEKQWEMGNALAKCVMVLNISLRFCPPNVVMQDEFLPIFHVVSF